MVNKTVSTIKRSQKESLLARTISQFLTQAAMDDSDLRGISITHVVLSPDKSICTIFFYSPEGQEHFEKVLKRLALYKPSFRKALAAEIKSRYVPNLAFRYDPSVEKQIKLEALLDQVKKEDEESLKENS